MSVSVCRLTASDPERFRTSRSPLDVNDNVRLVFPPLSIVRFTSLIVRWSHHTLHQCRATHT